MGKETLSLYQLKAPLQNSWGWGRKRTYYHSLSRKPRPIRRLTLRRWEGKCWYHLESRFKNSTIPYWEIPGIFHIGGRESLTSPEDVYSQGLMRDQRRFYHGRKKTMLLERGEINQKRLSSIVEGTEGRRQ